MEWKFASDIPIYIQLVEQIKAKIISGEYLPGEKLKSVRELATDAGVNPNTMQKAMAELERVGLVHTQRTSGRYITENTELIDNIKLDVAKVKLEEFYHSMRQIGVSDEEILNLVSNRLKGVEVDG